MNRLAARWDTGKPTTQDISSITVPETDIDSVPEPASLAIFGTAFVGLGFLRRRKKAA
ncbi:MAG TPA: PEP-CTERM sorting domain-containing protein [Stellaceae bacterium]|nr:PEP-CTERM sorting domain-containing protein [Stellaceae bacterium]